MNHRQAPAEEQAGVLSYLQTETRRHLEGRNPDLIIVTQDEPLPTEKAFDPETLRTLKEDGTPTIICRREDIPSALKNAGIPLPRGIDDIPAHGLAIVEERHDITVAALSTHRPQEQDVPNRPREHGSGGT